MICYDSLFKLILGVVLPAMLVTLWLTFGVIFTVSLYQEDGVRVEPWTLGLVVYPVLVLIAPVIWLRAWMEGNESDDS